MITPDALARVKPKLRAGLNASMRARLDFDIISTFPSAREELAKKIARSPEFHTMRKATASITPVAGVIDLTVTALKYFLPWTFKGKGAIALATPAATPIFIQVENETDLHATHDTDVVLWWLGASTTGPAIKLWSTAAATFITAVVLTGNYIPETLADIPVSHEADFIDIVAGIFNSQNSNIMPDKEDVAQLAMGN